LYEGKSKRDCLLLRCAPRIMRMVLGKKQTTDIEPAASLLTICDMTMAQAMSASAINGFVPSASAA